jgi:glycosyltransferase involved in cell wall biosynthesis
LKIVHVVHQFPPEFRGGTEACVQTLAGAQRARGDEPSVIAGSNERSDARAGDPEVEVREETVDGLPVQRVLRRTGENYSMDYRLPRVADQVCALVARAAPDIVHLHHTLNLSADLAARLTAAGHTVVATLHDFTQVCARFFLVRPDGESCERSFPLPSQRCVECVLPDFPGGREALQHEAHARAQTAAGEAAALALAIVPRESVRAIWLRSGLFRPERLVTLPHAVGLATLPPPPARDRADGRLVLCTWGHLAPAKGLLDLLAAMHLVRDERLSLLVLGAPVDAEHAEALLDAAEGLDVTFRGRFTEADLPGLRAEADLAVFPSRAEETFGLVVAEARALGFPVIASDRGALPEGVGAAGAVVPAADSRTLAHLFAALLRDGSPLREWAAAARADQATPAEHADAVAALYTRALSERRA